MIENARVNSTITQIKAVDAASSTFQDMYDAVPGDMINADVRVPNVTNNGDGNNRINGAPFVDPTAATDESVIFFEHIGGADLLVGALSTNGISADIRGAEITVGQTTAVGGLGIGTNVKSGRYAVVAEQAGGPDTDGLTQAQAARIDRKLDDGDPTTGSVVANEGTAGACGAAGGYEEADDTVSCSIAARIN
ncbi:MAG: hypothetical protein ACLFP8_00415 [Alphaproteobacteria bacterium]